MNLESNSKLQDTFSEILKALRNDEERESLHALLKDFLSNLQQRTKTEKQNDDIVSLFFKENTVYFNKTSKIFFHYSNMNYIVSNEDNTIFYVSDFISCNKSIMHNFDLDYKQQIKNKIMRSIKNNCNIYENIPETETIQSILGLLYPTIFPSKFISKAFLVFIGDILNKKISNKSSVLCFMNTNLKNFLSEINRYASMYFSNTNIFNYIKFKYTNDHENSACIILQNNEIDFRFIKLTEQLYVNLLCVSIHYSNRYENVLSFVKNGDDDIKDEATDILSLISKDGKRKMISEFKNTYLIRKNGQYIHEKDLLFLWKKYLTDKRYFVTPFNNYTETIKELFIDSNNIFNEEIKDNILEGYYSLDIPNIKNFIDFWKKHCFYDETEIYMELTEILFLFNNHSKHKRPGLSEVMIKHIIQVNFPEINIVSGKYIHNLRCSLWNKKKEIDDFINTNSNVSHQTNNALYNLYCNEKKQTNGTKAQCSLKISKKYFDIYLKSK